MDEILQYEKERWKEKGIYWIFGVALFMFYPFILPELVKPLFEYMLLWYGELPTFVCVMMIVHHTSYTLHSIFLIAIALIKNPKIECYRVNPAAWPWDADMALVKRNIVTLFFNYFLIHPLVAYFGYQFSIFTPRIDTNYPQFTEILWQIFFCMVAEDIWSYTTHSLAHWGPIYRKIHKKHHQYTITIGISAEYAHPLELLFVNTAAAAFGAVILGNKIHYITFMAWISYRIGDTVDQHGGYEFPCSPFSILPFATTAHYHDYHHSNNTGNYASQFGILDAVFNTSAGFYKHMKKRTLRDVRRAPQGSHSE